MKLRCEKTIQEPGIKAAEAAAIQQEVGDERFFDPCVDLTEEDYQSCINAMDSYREDGSWAMYASMARQILFLFPERFRELELDSNTFERVLTEVKKRRESWGYHAAVKEVLITLFPERREELGLDDVFFNNMKNHTDSQHSNGKWAEYFQTVIYVYILFPERRREMVVDDSAVDGLKKELIKAQGKGDQWNHLYMAANAAVLLPDRKAEFMPTNKQIDDMLADMESMRKHNPSLNAGMARSLMILAADEVRITDHGLEMVYHKPLERGRVLPERNLAI